MPTFLFSLSLSFLGQWVFDGDFNLYKTIQYLISMISVSLVSQQKHTDLQLWESYAVSHKSH